MTFSRFFFFVLFSSFCLNLKPITFVAYEKIDETSVSKLIEKDCEIEPFLCFNPLEKITSVEYMVKACSLALKILEHCENGNLDDEADKIKILCFGRTFNIVFLASMLLDEENKDVLIQYPDGETLNLVTEKPFSFAPKDRVSNLRSGFEEMFKDFEKTKDLKKELDLTALDWTDEKGLLDVLFFDEFNEVFKFCHEKITELKKSKKPSISKVVTLLVPNDFVYFFKPSCRSIEKIRNLYSFHKSGVIFLGKQTLPFDNLYSNFLNIKIMKGKKKVIKKSVMSYLLDPEF